MFSSKVVLVMFYATTTYFNVVYCVCKQTYFVTCDDFEDTENIDDNENWTELIIGGNNGLDDTQLMEMDLANTNFLRFKNLKRLVVNHKIKNLKSHYPNAWQCAYNSLKLEHLSFYGNELRYLEKYNRFPLIPLKKLSLVFNQIQIIKSGTFAAVAVEHFDVSKNLLEVIEKEALPSTGHTKIIKIRNNALSHIEPGSFTLSLVTLNLDNNKLESFEKGVLENLGHLEEFTLSHNNFYILPDLSHLAKLKIFDISFNAILSIGSQQFTQVKSLQLFNLNHNNISNSNILGQFQHLPKKSMLLLAFNQIKELNHSDVRNFGHNYRLSLYGNPWDCLQWEWVKNELIPYQNWCDLKHFTNGETPYCVNYNWKRKSDSIGKKDLQRFYEETQNSSKSTSCNLDKFIFSKNYIGCFESVKQ